MDIVNFWTRQIANYNKESKCGFCWTFSAPLIESSINKVQFEEAEACCVKVFLLQDKQPAFSTTNNYNSLTGMQNGIVCNNSFQLLVVMPSTLGTMNHDEMIGHDSSTAKWETILNRLQQCLSCDVNLDFCEILGTQYRITTWSGTQVINYLDSVYCGYRINVNFQKVN